MRLNIVSDEVLRDIFRAAVAEPPRKLGKVAVKMLDGDMMESAHNAALEQRPEGLHCVGVGFAFNHADAMVDGLVEQLALENTVAPELVAVDNLDGILVHGASDEVSDGFGLEVGDHHALHFARPGLGAFYDADDLCLLAVFAGSAGLVIFAAQVGVVGFQDAAQLVLYIGVLHGVADAMAQVPRGLIGHVQMPHELVGTDALLALTDEVDCQQPLAQRQVGAVHDRVRGDRELILALGALIAIIVLQARNGGAVAPWARNTFGPTHFLKILAALCLGVEPSLEFVKIHANLL